MLWPFFTFYGGKWRVAPHYPSPIHDMIVEPFAGSAGYSLRYPEKEVVLIEKDPVIAETWRYLIKSTASEILSLPDIGNEQSVDDLDIPKGAKFLIGWWCNKGAATPCKKPSSWMRSGLRPNSFWGQVIKERISMQVDKIKHWRILEGDYEASPNIEATWFIDPPYVYAGKHYKFGSSKINYDSLSEWVQKRLGQTIVCEGAGANWLPFSFWRDIKASPAKHGGKVSHELVWYNGKQKVKGLFD